MMDSGIIKGNKMMEAIDEEQASNLLKVRELKPEFLQNFDFKIKAMK